MPKLSCKYLLLFLFLHTFSFSFSQQGGDDNLFSINQPSTKSFTIGITQPPSSPVRAMAEWEELASVAITWSAFWNDSQRDTLLARIAVEVKEECDVVILCDACNKIKSRLFNISGIDRLEFDIPQPDGTTKNTKITLRPIEGGTNRIWIRDYGAHTVYTNSVDTLLFIDWKYNTSHPQADTVPSAAFAQHYGVPLYSTTLDEYALRLDGGNFLTDGMGNAFSSELVNNRNSFCEGCDIQQTAADFMGIQNYHILPKLQHDVIHHVDMYMKIIDEETILFGEYPPEAADYERLEANVDYFKTLKTPFGNDYKIIRIAMPPDQYGEFPGVPLGESAGCSAIGKPCFRTYINALFVNKTVLVPTYGIPYDSIALDIWQRAKPGYRIVGIDCNGIIPQYGAIHCVTKEIGVKEPLLITHEQVKEVCVQDENTTFKTTIQHRSGVREAYIHYRTNSNEAFTAYELSPLSMNDFAITLPNAISGTTIQYYFSAIANSGKIINRPLPAPLGFYSYEVDNCIATAIDPILPTSFVVTNIAPNPVREQIQIEIISPEIATAKVQIYSLLGQLELIHQTLRLETGTNPLILPLSDLNAGVYQLVVQTKMGRNSQLFVKM
ncbi:MAG: agmatine deiminase family protein [Saprospiraceae bacterium]